MREQNLKRLSVSISSLSLTVCLSLSLSVDCLNLHRSLSASSTSPPLSGTLCFSHKSRQRCQSSVFLLLLRDPMRAHGKHRLCIKSLMWLILPLSAENLLDTHEWAASLHLVTCSFITMNMGNVIYFQSIQHIHCPAAVNRAKCVFICRLQTVPNKYTVSCCCWKVGKLQSPDVSGDEPF